MATKKRAKKGTSRKKPEPPPREAAAKGGSVTFVQREERLLKTETLMLQGATRPDLLRDLGALYGIGSTQVDDLAAQVRERWEEDAEKQETREQAKAAAIKRVSGIAYAAHQEGNLSVAVQAEKLRAQIEGTLAPTKVEETRFSHDQFNKAGWRRLVAGEDPRTILDTGGAAGDPEPEGV
jgi:hypothetical protein